MLAPFTFVENCNKIAKTDTVDNCNEIAKTLINHKNFLCT